MTDTEQEKVSSRFWACGTKVCSFHFLKRRGKEIRSEGASNQELSRDPVRLGLPVRPLNRGPQRRQSPGLGLRKDWHFQS